MQFYQLLQEITIQTIESTDLKYKMNQKRNQTECFYINI